MKGRMVTMWHPDSPGVRITAWVPWYRSKRRRFARLTEVLRSYRKPIDNTAHPGSDERPQ